MSIGPTIVTAREKQLEGYPFRRVWRTALIEIIILLVLTTITAAVMRFLHPSVGETQRRVFGLVFALLPFGLWMLVSYRGERTALRPRPSLLFVLLLGGLVANAIVVPLSEKVFNVESWLVTESGGNRIIGYMLVIGIPQEFLKYAVVRYTLWPGAFRIRADGIAYAMAVSVGYATALNLNLVTGQSLDPAAAALRITETSLMQVAIGTLMGYLLAEMKFSDDLAIFSLPGGLLLAGLLTGIGITVRGGLVVGGIGPNLSGSNAFQGLGIAVGLVLILFISLNFLISNADERALLRSRPEHMR